MQIKFLDQQVSVSEQINNQDVKELAANGVEILVCNRPDGEQDDQPAFENLATIAAQHSLTAVHIPFAPGAHTEEHQQKFASLLSSGKRVHAYCRTGTRSTNLWTAVSTEPKLGSNNPSASDASTGSRVTDILSAKDGPAFQHEGGRRHYYDVAIMGAGSAGIAVAASLRQRADLKIALIDDATEHFYQPGWTMVGGGVFDAKTTRRKTSSLIPKNVDWLQHKVSEFIPDEHCVLLSNGDTVRYEHLVVAPGLTLDWSAIEGLEESLGRNGVTSNYRYDLAPYTWDLVRNLNSGKAVFTQPPMPIKCAGAPQKALYLSADHWLKTGVIKDINIEFFNAGGVLFGVEAYVPALMSYMKKYDATLNFNQTLVKVNGEKQQAWFKSLDSDGNETITSTDFNMLHACPPQRAPSIVRNSELCDISGWLDVDPSTLQHKKHSNVWGLGDVMNTPNAKTMAAARKQAPVVAQNISDALARRAPSAHYDGYGSCPLTVEKGKIVLAEFGYGGKILPTFPSWLNDGTKPTRLAWLLKARILPALYWHGMLKGREWLATPNKQLP